MSSPNREASWTTAFLDALAGLRPLLWTLLVVLAWLAVSNNAQAQTFPWPPPDTGCGIDQSCIPTPGPGNGNPGHCTPNPNGDPGCGGAGNPVEIITGNKYQHEVDLAPLPGELGLHFSRHYNSNSTHRGLTGIGWRSSYEIVLVDLGTAVQIIDADGRRLTFNRNDNQPSLCVGARLEDGRVIVEGGEATDSIRKARPLTYRWQRLDGAEYVFGSGTGDGHPLQSIRAASGATVTLNYLGGALDSVHDPQGRTLRFIYARPLAAGSTRHRMLTLSAIDTPVGRVTYKHDEFGRLQSAIQPSGLTHRYHYEAERQGATHNTWALTGISVEWIQDGKALSERLSTYVYDAQGRAVRTQHAGGDDLTLAYGPKAATTITTALGARTVYRHALVAGQWKTVEALGPGCATCPPSNVRYRYRTTGPQAGHLEATLQLDAQAKPMQQERVAIDGWGRPTRVERIRYTSGKPPRDLSKAELVLRAEYAAMPQNLQGAALTAAQYAALWRPTLVARPSVIAGREHTIGFSYNAHLQPVQKTETGFSPLDGVGKLAATELTRTTTFRYSQIAGASRLVAIDGPLPGSEDTKTFHYDDQGRLRLVQHPVPDLQERFAYDDAGRVAWHAPVDGVEVRTVYPAAAESLATRHWLPASITRAQRASSYQYNPRGWLVRWSDGPRKMVELTYDSTGRVSEAKDAEGWRVAITKDQAKQIEATLWYAPGSTEPLRGWYRWFDQSGRTTRTLQPDGRIDEFFYNAQGLLSEHIDGDGVAHFYRQSKDGQRRARIDWAPDDQLRLNVWQTGAAPDGGGPSAAQTQRNGGAPRSLRDDFGRVVRVSLPDHGPRTARYDAADRFEQIRFIDGATVTYEHDAAGRMKSKVAREPDGTESQRVTLRYQGAYLAEVNDNAQTTAYRYDSFGRRIETRITLRALPQQTYTMDTDFDGDGEPVKHRLVDGRALLIKRDPANGRAQSIQLQQGGLRPTKTLLADISSHALNGVTGFQHGNGVNTTLSHDLAGRLIALNVDGVADLSYEYGAGTRIKAIRDGKGAAGHQPVRVALDYEGFGALKSPSASGAMAIKTQDISQSAPPPSLAKWDAPLHKQDSRGRLIADGRFEYHYDALDRLVVVRNLESRQLVARYAYNAFGERVSKSVVNADGNESTRYFLYQRQRLVAEAEGNGTVDRQYLYLNGKPFTTIVANRILAIHTDHRGAPLAMTDEQQRVVWRGSYRDAWGELTDAQAEPVGVAPWKQALHTASDGRFGERRYGAAQLNLRLPGQYADAESGLHYNLHRYYDPRERVGTRETTRHPISHRGAATGGALHGKGRYLTPDPLGYPDGPDPYQYASGDPVNKIDPLGLYEVDVHYYVTFFLAVVAGMRPEDARTMAMAAQFIDDNPSTRPVDPFLFTNWPDPFSVFRNRDRLLRYHFVFSDPVTGTVPTQYQNGDMSDPDAKSAQLRALYSYAVSRPQFDDCGFNQSLQFMGEYLHAFQDTFAHRNRQDIPYDASIWRGLGIGHGLDGHDADYTYNHDNVLCYTDDFGMPQCATSSWQVNEDRTIAMEQQVYQRIISYMDEMNFSVQGRRSRVPLDFSAIEDTLRKFNAIPANEHSDEEAFRRKIDFLNTELRNLGFDGIDMSVDGVFGYDRVAARANRRRNFAGLSQADFPNAILETRWGR
jgi:YD repeat-containing protein